MPRGKKNVSGQQRRKAKSTAIVVVSSKSRSPPQKKKKSQKKKPMRGSGVQGRNELGPLNMGRNFSVKPFMTDSQTLTGCDFLATVQTGSASINVSEVLNDFLLNPLSMVSGSRLAQFGSLWDKYKFEELTVFYEPSVGSTTAGRITLAADCDVIDDYSSFSGNALSQKLASLAHNIQVQVAHTGVLSIKDKRFFDTIRYVEPITPSDPRLTYSGRLWVASTGGLASSTTYGSLYIRWRIRFTNPNIDTAFTDGTAIIYAPTGSYVTSTYPIGDFTATIAAYEAGGAGALYLPSPTVVFSSNASLGSVITFNSVGNYLITVGRTGAAMGTGITSEGVYTGCALGWPTNSSGITSLNQAFANAGSTGSLWVFNLSATVPGATATFTGDSGVTHNSSLVTVTRVTLPLESSALLAPLPLALNEVDIRRMIEKMFIEKGVGRALTSPSKVKPGTDNHTLSSAGVFSTIASPAGEPVVTYQYSGNTNTETGTVLDPIVTVVDGAKKTPKSSRKKKFTFVEAAPSDEEEAD